MNKLGFRVFLKADSIRGNKISVESGNFMLPLIHFDTSETTTNKTLRSAHIHT